MKNIILLLFLASPVMAAYNYTTPLIVLHNQVAATELNLPVLLSTNAVIMSTASAGGHMLNSNGYDFVFSTFSDCHYLLHWDTETVNTTGTTQMNVWVQVPSLSSSTDTVFYACYGNAAIITYQGISSATWDSNYKAVYHLPNGSVLTANDSTSGGLGNGTITGTTATTGKIDGAGAFVSSSNQIINFGVHDISGYTGLTASAWFKTSTASAEVIFGVWSDIGSGENYLLYTDPVAHGLIQVSGSGGIDTHGSVSLADGNWHYAAETWSTGGAYLNLYVDGVFVSSISASGTNIAPNTLNQPTYMGAYGSLQLYFNGSVDETRLSNASRSADWISTEYNNQSSPSTFLIFDTEINNAPLLEANKGVTIKGGSVTMKSGKVAIR